MLLSRKPLGTELAERASVHPSAARTLAVFFVALFSIGLAGYWLVARR